MLIELLDQKIPRITDPVRFDLRQSLRIDLESVPHSLFQYDACEFRGKVKIVLTIGVHADQIARQEFFLARRENHLTRAE